jgi:ABC-type bacteriocin/lantibiotic exporter with double-glycine peptidase domain
VGASGSGKSTLLRLLLGFEVASRGTVRFDGRDLADLDLRSLRSRIGTVLQGGRLWAGDILANIVGATSLTVDDAWEAARAAGLAADIEAMPMGMYTLVGEGVSTLSGGQRQRVLIAQGIVQEHELLVLDEPLTGLDLNSAATIDTLIHDQRADGCTVILTTHDLDEARAADWVVLVSGRVVACGPPAEVCTRHNLEVAYGLGSMHEWEGFLDDPAHDTHHH